MILVAFCVCIALSWFVIVENKAFEGGPGALLGQFEPRAKAVATPARAAFLATACFVAAACLALLVLAVRAAS